MTTPTKTRLPRSYRLIHDLFLRIESGTVSLTRPDGVTVTFGPADAPRDRTANITVTDWTFFRNVLHGGATGLALAYVRGLWRSDDLVAFLRIMAADRRHMRRLTVTGVTRIIFDRVLHSLRGNRKRQAPVNIAAHYDLSNAFYATFLDDTMTYSSAVFSSTTNDLKAAQIAKYERLCQLAELKAGMRVLEVGCGWGGFAIYAASTYGAHVTGITLSNEQARYAREQVAKAGLDQQITIAVIDYRDVAGSYDRIVSIEMLEAVGHRYLGAYFKTLDERLAPGGAIALQVITIPEQRYRNYRRRPDFIQRYIFPGGHLPSLEVLTKAMRGHSRLVVNSVTNIATDYATTLRQWRERFNAARDEVGALGFDERFQRQWEFYLAYCEAGFTDRLIGNLQLQIVRPGYATHPG